MGILPLVVGLLLVPLGQDSGVEVKGTVTLMGPRPERKLLKPDHDHEDVLAMYPGGVPFDPVDVDKEGRVRWAFVYIKKGLEGKTFEVPKEKVALEFDRFRIRQRVLGIRVGQTLEMSNLDRTIHNAHAFPADGSGNKETSDIFPPGGAPKTRTFTHPEIGIGIWDDRHSKIARCWVNVVAHPFFSVTNEKGEFRIKGLPPGKYTLEVWQEHCMPVSREIEVGDKESKVANFEIEFVWTK